MSTKEEINLLKQKIAYAKLMKKKETFNKKLSSVKVPRPKFGKFRDVSRGLPFKREEEKRIYYRWL